MTTQTLDKPAPADVVRTNRACGGRCYQPNVDIVESPAELTLYADMPGVRGDGVDVNFENGTLTLVGKVGPRQKDDTNFLLREYGLGDFHRTFQVGEAIDAEKITAELVDGVLTLHLPKAEAARPRKIAVKTN